MVDRSPLAGKLAAVIPQDLVLNAYHISTFPNKSSALFAPLPDQQEEATTCESHFLAISSSSNDQQKELLIFGVEVLIFTSASLTTVFVSKADSTGFSSRHSVAKGSPSVVATIISTFLDYLLEPRLTRARVVLSLFARSQNQYLFPGSSENEGKHVLNDRQLIKWWCRIVDRVLRPRSSITPAPSRITAHLIVPGCERAETRTFFPSSARLDPATDPKWFNSYPVELLVPNISKATRSLIPRLPDDPKARFLDDLDGEFMDSEGNWRSVKTLDQFWEMLSYRQECSAGRLVGFLWVVFSRGQIDYEPLSHIDPSRQLVIPAKPQTNVSEPIRLNGVGISVDHIPCASKSNLVDPAAPIEASISPEGSRLDSTSTSSEVLASLGDQSGSEAPNLIHATSGELVVKNDEYDRLMEYLLQTDFAGLDLAAEYTRGWILKALEISGAPTFGQTIRGQLVLASSSHGNSLAQPNTPVNLLTGIRKKRKAETPSSSQSVAAKDGDAGSLAVNLLQAEIIRKRVKS